MLVGHVLVQSLQQATVEFFAFSQRPLTGDLLVDIRAVYVDHPRALNRRIYNLQAYILLYYIRWGQRTYPHPSDPPQKTPYHDGYRRQRRQHHHHVCLLVVPSRGAVCCLLQGDREVDVLRTTNGRRRSQH